jgi:hypothetical protein
MDPPWASTMALQMARPTPLELLPPPAEGLEDAGPVEGGHADALVGHPRLTIAPPLRAPTRTVERCGMWRAAFSSRLVTTWSSWL